jgi:hypothetical protein
MVRRMWGLAFVISENRVTIGTPDRFGISMRNELRIVCIWMNASAALLVALGSTGCSPPIAASSSEGLKTRVAADSAPSEPELPDATVSGEPPSERSASSAASTENGAATASEPATAPKVNRPPRADRLPPKPGEAEKITFDDLNLQMLANIVFRPFMVTDRVKELEGQRVSISGFMHGAAAGLKGVKEFVLLKNTECKFGPDGQADHLAMIYLKNGTTTKYTTSDITVEGTLRIEPYTGPDGNTWSIYNLEDARIR